MPTPSPRPSPAPPGFAAAVWIAFAAWNRVKSSRLPAMPILERVSMACSTSGGTDMFSITNLGMAMPLEPSSAVSASESCAPMAS